MRELARLLETQSESHIMEDVDVRRSSRWFPNDLHPGRTYRISRHEIKDMVYFNWDVDHFFVGNDPSAKSACNLMKLI